MRVALRRPWLCDIIQDWFAGSAPEAPDAPDAPEAPEAPEAPFPLTPHPFQAYRPN
jgi:hypothetical protein